MSVPILKVIKVFLIYMYTLGEFPANKMYFIFPIQIFHYENMPIQIYRKNLPPKIEKFRVKNANIFLISTQNIDCGYSLEPPQ